ncbi:sugar ABC transporter ATP-binding protein [Glaciibacter psychrotolerans]|uniref:Simple sugar transport system ATP-binding protein n=1 Tax=Glaciibacter psychrotolerans TaxID=670054 RepID=A0A7Z0J7F1_9MICO|nr:sugar ABC transporter ATP-binding protein [Leifsonia psychrotolerans]NYJ20888.1 simple sugar transport system ATP-binding protein [Leifsonia psychrotolerans]
MEYALKLADIVKDFGPNRVLRGVGFAVEKGEIYSLMGANGAGKSTLIRVLSGAHRADGGQIELNGAVVDIHDPLSAQRHGIGTVQQNPNDGVVLDMTVAENLALDTFVDAREGLFVNRAKTEARAGEIAGRLGLDVTPAFLRTPVRDLGVSERQLLVIARALSRRPKILVLDEPTSALSGEEVSRLFALVRDLVGEGMSVLFVTHKLAEIAELADRVGVLRDGEMRGEFSRDADGRFEWSAVLTELFDKTPSELSHEELPGGDVALRLSGAQVFADSDPFDLDLRTGEVTALLGLLGSGKSELLEWIFGAHTIAGGTIALNGTELAARHPADAIARGVYLVPESRHEQSIVPEWSIDTIMTLPFLTRFSPVVVMDRAAEREAAQQMIDRIGIVTSGPTKEIETLSGGNQQKVVIGRWLLEDPKLLLLDEPFRGVDINARHDIAETIREVTALAPVLVATSDIDEALEVADRILVFHAGSVVADMRLSEATRARIVEAMSTSTHARHAVSSS